MDFEYDNETDGRYAAELESNELEEWRARAEKAEAKLQQVHEWLADNEAVHQLDIGLDALSDILND